MNGPRSLQRRLAVTLGILLTVFWIGAAAVTSILARNAIEDIFDSSLQETAQRILPLAVVDVLTREEEGLTQRLSEIHEHDELLSYVVRDDQGRILLQSHDADPAVFPAWDGAGFRQTATHRLYNESAVQGTVQITVAELRTHRTAMTREIQLLLVFPILIFLPVVLLAIVLAVRSSLVPVKRFRDRLATRGQRDLSRIPTDGLPAEVAPVADTLNDVLGRLSAAFDAERTFAANAAHELRTPIAGAIAQIQRLQTETGEAATRQRAADIESTLKRLTRVSERLMQLARAEGGRLRLDHSSDLRPVARILTDDLARTAGPDRIVLVLPDTPLLSYLDPDVFAILYRNLVENALRHGAQNTPVHVTLSENSVLTVANDGPVIPEALLQRLTHRFERGSGSVEGSGLGLAIVNAIAERLGCPLQMKSPRTGQSAGLEVSLALPLTK
ncbi:MAG: ATP-binding protein [Burkholderiaceae bacterium]|jgi:two-component system OmpR family sensor kinase